VDIFDTIMLPKISSSPSMAVFDLLLVPIGAENFSRIPHLPSEILIER